MRESLYIIGAPGSGKSSVVAELLPILGLRPTGEHHLTRETFITHLGPRAWMWGKFRDQFPGTDALGLAASRYCREWIEDHPEDLPELTIGEGIRFSNARFLLSLDAVAPVTLVYLECGSEATRERCINRPGKTLTDKYQATARSTASGLATSMELLGLNVLRFQTETVSPKQTALLVADRLAFVPDSR